MSTAKLSTKDIVFIGLMLFSLFFGAGNLIFPPLLGQEAGTNFWPAIIGFLISGVGLPLLGVLAITYANSDDAEGLSRRVHPHFAIGLTSLTYLAVGPLFAVPRTGTVSFEIAIMPLVEATSLSTNLALFVFTIAFFAMVYWLALHPGKFVDRIGKILTPALLTILLFLFIRVLTGPLGSYQAPRPDYENFALFRGVTEGYLTMDTIVSFVFAIIIVKVIKDRGVTEPRQIRNVTLKASLVAALCLGGVYLGLGYLGATSATHIGNQENGGAILSLVSGEYFGVYGNIILGLSILFACIPTAAGLISSCATYFHKRLPKLSYKALVISFTLFSAAIANIGLNQLIAFSLPVLVFIYPIITVLIFLAFLDRITQGRREVYQLSVPPTGIVSFNDGLQEAGLGFDLFQSLPFASLGFGWVIPAIVGGLIGFVVSLIRQR
ncbi:branched-chain amino acid transport system II carrier protein [Shouchella shacheensis]|uniref:branched-chain amino acid transport system II carrier protein n=1 Tax=Shouchella shacheensis TaxID=1649580 RepID=UPI0009EBB73E|nr:branched-chain amino acid transport system II carrier protein [Shouchella shacheensis]